MASGNGSENGDTPSIDPNALLAALSVDLRREIYRLMGEGPMSPKEVATVLQLPLPNVSYHVTALRDAGLIELAREARRRGAIEHYYRHAPHTKPFVRRIVRAADEAAAKYGPVE